MTALALALALVGAGWGFVADRIAARWPEHEAEEGQASRPAGWVRPIDWRTPIVAATGAAAMAGVGSGFPEPPELLVVGGWAAALVLLFATDLDQRLLPDVVTLPLIPLAVVVVLAGLDPFLAPADLPLAALVAVVVPIGLYALSIPFGAGAFGLGDVKFLVGFGLFAGVERFLVGLVAGVLLGGVVILALLALRRISLRTYVPYGPFLILGALWALLGPR